MAKSKSTSTLPVKQTVPAVTAGTFDVAAEAAAAGQNPDVVVLDTATTDLAKITDPQVIEALIAARFMAIRKFTFMGYMIMSTEFLACDSIPTMAACIIGKQHTIVLNQKFFLEGLTSDAQRLFAVMHELMHIFLYHIGRQTENCYHPELWNIAADYVINAFLFHMNKDVAVNGHNIIELPEWVLHDERFYGMSADAVYHQLLKENGGDADKAAGNHGGDSDITVVMNGGGKGKNKQRSFDKIGREPMTTGQKTAMDRTVAASVSGDTRDSMKEYGEGTADLFRLFASYGQERVDWKDTLRNYVVNASKSRSTYTRVSRRSEGSVVFPSLTGDHINVIVGGDTSGSMSEGDLGEVRDEIASIMRNFESWEMNILTCDTTVYPLGHFSSENGDTAESVDVQMRGGGGTDMNPIIAYANDGGEFDNNDGDIVTIIVTDGYMPPLTEEVMTPTIVVITTHGNKDFKTENENVQLIQMEA